MVARAPKSSPRPRRWVRRTSSGCVGPRWCADTSSNRTGLSTVARRRDPRRHRSSKADIPDKAWRACDGLGRHGVPLGHEYMDAPPAVNAGRASRWSSLRRECYRPPMIFKRVVERSLRIACCCAAILACACAHAPPPLHSARLKIQESEGAYAAFVRARVAGEPIFLLVDTGAAENSLPESFVRARGMSARSPTFADGYRDATGTIAYLGRLSGVLVQFDGETEAGKLDFVVNPNDLGGIGILAPQQLVRSGNALVIDLGRAELRYEAE